MGSMLLTTKLGIPPVRSDLLARSDLLQRLERGLTSRLILLSAPAGYGKTTLLGAWCSQPALRGRVAWLSLDGQDNDPARFLGYLVAALQNVDPHIGETVPAMLQPPHPQPAPTIMAALINDVAASEKRVVLVLDDYHLVENQAVHRALEFLVEHMPDRMCLVIATRADPPLPLARLRAHAQLLELRATDLAFNLDEAAGFLRQILGMTISDDLARALLERTEGWAAGLQVAAVSMHGKQPDQMQHFARAFAASNRHILDYLVEEVLQGMHQPVQDFLLQTSILEALSAPVCDALLGQAGMSQSMLQQLEQKNLFILPLDDHRQWYRYHRLFRDLLYRRLQHTSAELIGELHRRAAGWYAQNGLAGEAIQHACAAGDFQWAADLLKSHARTMLMRSEIRTLQGWFERLPDEQLKSHPELCVYYALVLQLSGRPAQEVREILRQADSQAQLAVEALVISALTFAFVGDAHQSLEFARRAQHLLPSDDYFFDSLLASSQGMAYVLQGDIDAAVPSFERGVLSGQKAGNVMFAVSSLSNLAGLCMVQGQLQRARALYERALEGARDPRGQLLPVAGRALFGLGELEREFNHLEAAERYLTDGLQLFERYVQSGSMFNYLHLARLQQLRGDFAAAQTLLESARRLAQESETLLDDWLVDLSQAHLWLNQGDLHAVERMVEGGWLGRLTAPAGSQNAQGPLPASYDMQEGGKILLARLELRRARPRQALQLLHPLRESDEEQGRLRRLIQVLVLQACALAQLAEVGETGHDQAQEVFEKALALAEPHGYVRIFLDEGDSIIELLHTAAAQGPHAEYARRLLAGAQAAPVVQSVRASSVPETPAVPALVEPLSGRELEVLELIAAGLTNQEVADRLMISLSTVKGHTANIYGKLSVNSRTHAVAKARELGLLT